MTAQKLWFATKGAQIVNGDKVSISNQPADLEKFVKSSLERLGTDYLDIFYIHFPDKQTPKDEAINKLVDLKKQGLIKAIGVSNFSLDQLKEANKNHDVDIVEDQYSLVHRDAEKDYSLIGKTRTSPLSPSSHLLRACWQVNMMAAR